MIEAEQYARWVLSPDNELKTGRLIKLAAERFLRDLKREDIYFDEEEANRMILFGERYCHQWEGAWRGEPVKFELWQKFIFQQVFGWFRTADKLRRFSRVYIQVSKKNGKSTMCAVLANYHLFADERIKTPKVFTAANNEEQAKICVNMAGKIIKQSPDLSAYVDDGDVSLHHYGENIVRVVHNEKDGFIKALSKESSDKNLKTTGGKHGLNPSLGIVDEFGMSPDHGASKTIETAMASRFEGLMFYITTAGYNLDGPCYRELRASGVKVLEGSIELDNYLPIIFELDKDDDWKDESVWNKCTPNLDVSVNRQFLRQAVADAVNYGGTQEVDVKTLNFNMWVDSPEVFISSEKWATNNHGITDADLLGQVCYGGIEINSGLALNAMVLLFPDIKGKVALKCFFWMPQEYTKSRECEYYRDWAKDGLIYTTPGGVADNAVVLEWLKRNIEKYQVHSIAYKTNLAANDVVQGLDSVLQINPISHGPNSISTPTSTWEELINAGSVDHMNNKVLAWMNSNCLAVRKKNETIIQKSGSKVVGIYAAINAVAQWKSIDNIQPDTEVIIL